MNKVETYDRKNILSQIKWLIKMVRYLLGKETSEGGSIQSIQEGANISIDNTDPQNPVVSSTGDFIEVTEGGKTGYRLSKQLDTPTHFGSIGDYAIDFTQNDSTVGSYGATGTASISMGVLMTASGDYTSVIGGALNSANSLYGSVFGGYNNHAEQSNATVIGGVDNYAKGNGSLVGGMGNTASSMSEVVLGRYSTLAGGNATAVVATDRLFNIGNGSSSARSNAFTILKNGLATLPSVNNALIDAEPTGKAVVTKEWVNGAINAIPTPSLTLEQARQNWNVLSGDIEFDSGYHRISQQSELSGEVWIDFSSTNRTIGIGSSWDYISKLTVSEDNIFIQGQKKGLLGTDEFDKQGDRKAYAQIADVEDFYKTITGYDAGATQTLKNINGVLTWVTEKVG